MSADQAVVVQPVRVCTTTEESVIKRIFATALQNHKAPSQRFIAVLVVTFKCT